MQNSDSPVELTRVPNDMLAAPLVSAHVVGAFTAGFFAEAPGAAQIMVKAGELAAAQAVLERYNADADEDIGEELSE